MNKQMIKGAEYYIHPKYRDYGVDSNGNIINVCTNKRPRQSRNKDGYIIVNIPGIFRYRNKFMRCIFNYECYYNSILDDIAMHFDGDKTNDSLNNLFIIS